MSKILIIDAFSIYHVGNAALLESSIEQIKSQFSDAEITILAFDPDSIGKMLPEYKVLEGLWAQPLSSFSLIGKIKWMLCEITWAFINGLNYVICKKIKISIKPCRYTFSSTKRAVIEAYSDTDMVVSISGEMLNETFWKRLPMFLYGYWLGNVMGKIVVIFPQSIGSFENFFISKAVRYVLNQCDLVLPRDQISLENVKELGISNSKVHLVPDVALNQPYVDSDKAKYLLREEGVNLKKQPLIGITLSKFNDSDFKKYSLVIRHLCQLIITEMKGTVVFFSPNMPYKQEISDFSLAQDLYKELPEKENVVVLSNVYNPREFKGMLGELDLFITTRMHASILATMIGIPTITINSQPKLRGYMAMIHQEERSCEIENFTIAKATELIKDTLANSAKISESLENTKNERQVLASMASKLLRDVYDKNHSDKL